MKTWANLPCFPNFKLGLFLGSAGLDSSMFSHLKRNWHFHSMLSPHEKTAKRQATDSLVPKKRLKVDEADKVKKMVLGHRVKSSSKKPAASSTQDGPKSLPYIPEVKLSKPQVVKRVLTKRKTTPRLPYYDEIDKKALMVRFN